MKCKCNPLLSPFHWAHQYRDSVANNNQWRHAEASSRNMSMNPGPPLTIYSKARQLKEEKQRL